VRFNTLFDLVKRDHWLDAGRSLQEGGGQTQKKRKLQPPQARSELFESDNNDDIAPTATEEPGEGLESETDNKTD
jgi:hypothetical protein